MKKLVAFLILVIILLAGGSGYYIYHDMTTISGHEVLEPPLFDVPQTLAENEVPETSQDVAYDLPQVTSDTAESKMSNLASFAFQGEAADPLIIGSLTAPITVTEYSSFSCPHCGFFHETTLHEIVKNYVNTGKVRFIFQDFPLNKQAFDASIIARCMPAEKRYSFMNLLFKTMTDWMGADNHLEALTQYAVIEGADREELQECMNDERVAESIITGARAASEANDISSTPSFVISDGTMITGSKSYEDFAKILDEALSKAEPIELSPAMEEMDPVPPVILPEPTETPAEPQQ